MPDRLYILVCRHFESEVATILDAPGYEEVSLATVDARCGHPPLTPEEIRQATGDAEPDDDICPLGGCCFAEWEAHAAEPESVQRLEQCFYLLTGRTTVDHYLAQGAYLTTPGYWPQKVQEWGFDRAGARSFFAESAARILLLDTDIQPDSEERLHAFAEFAIETRIEGEFVLLTFSDTGIGMDEEIRRRVFEPFFTTRMDVGAGLGLSTLRGTLQGWGGRVEVESAPGEGTAFTLYLPIAEEADR